MSKRRVGIVGYGNIGKYLVEAVLEGDDIELAFVWNRNMSAMLHTSAEKYMLEDLSRFAERKPDLIVEVAHPSIAAEYGVAFLQASDFMVGSPTAFASQQTENELRSAAKSHGLYIPSGAFWGGEDVRKMADRGTLQALKVTMTKHPNSFKLQGTLQQRNETVTEKTVLFEGAVRDLCPLAPNNVNTMAAAAMAAHNLGFDRVQGSIVADPHIGDWHLVEIEAWGPGDIASGSTFHVHTLRKNPAPVGHVTGKATYASFLSSMLAAQGKGPGVHLC